MKKEDLTPQQAEKNKATRSRKKKREKQADHKKSAQREHYSLYKLKNLPPLASIICKLMCCRADFIHELLFLFHYNKRN